MPSDLGNLADCTQIFTDIILAGKYCYQGSLQCNNQHKLTLSLAMKQEAMTNL